MPRLLDLFSGAGGAAVGYHRAGFDVVGVDINPQPRYPFEHHQGDAMTWPLEGFDVVHASPPCQAYVTLAGDGWPDLIGPVLERLTAWGGPWVIENVPTAPIHGLTICGQSFGLGVRRHRVFASNVFLMGPGCACGPPGRIRAYYGKPGLMAWKPPGWDNVQAKGRSPDLPGHRGRSTRGHGHRLDGLGRATRSHPTRVHPTRRGATHGPPGGGELSGPGAPGHVATRLGPQQRPPPVGMHLRVGHPLDPVHQPVGRGRRCAPPSRPRWGHHMVNLCEWCAIHPPGHSPCKGEFIRWVFHATGWEAVPVECACECQQGRLW